MIKFLIFLSLLIQLSLLNIGYAKEYRNTEAGFKINIPQQEINIVSKNFYGGMQPNGNFIYVYSLNQKQASDLLEENFTTDAFNDDYTAIELLERSGIDPQKASLKLLDPVLYWPSDKPFIKQLPNDVAFNIQTQKIHGRKSLNMQFTENMENEIKDKNSYLCSIDLLSANNRLYVISTKVLNSQKESEVSAESVRNEYRKGVLITKPSANTNTLIYTDKIGKFRFDLPENWYYVQSYFSDNPKACLTFALPLETLEKIKEKTQNLEANDLDKEKIADNVSEENIASWMDLLTESVWSVSCETKEFETAAYLENPEATKAEMQLLFSELKNYIESSRYYKNSKFDFDVNITPKIGYINFDLSFNLKDKKDFDNTGRIFFTKKKGGLVVYTSTLRNTEQPASKELIENIKILDLQLF